jgi:ribosomal protein L24
MSQQPTGFKDLLNSMMKRRWFITAMVLGSFILIIAGVFASITSKTEVGQEWKELLLLMLGAFIGSYGKIIDYWFSDTDKDKMLVQKMDEEDGVSMGSVNDIKESNKPITPLIPDAFITAAAHAHQTNLMEMDLKKDQQEHDQMMSKDQQEHEQEMEKLEFEHQVHRQCEHEWGDSDYDGELECQKCGKIKD